MGVTLAYLKYHSQTALAHIRPAAGRHMAGGAWDGRLRPSGSLYVAGKFGDHYADVNLGRSGAFTSVRLLGYYRAAFRPSWTGWRRVVQQQGVMFAPTRWWTRSAGRPTGYALALRDGSVVHTDVVLATVSPGLMQRIA
ncbi:MAG: hypothetical protein R2838_11875 [Caldilineaceae bacterium]